MHNHPYKYRIESNELQMLNLLNTRMELEENDKKRYYRLKKGYEGEVLFDSMTEKLQFNCLILNDLNLEVNNTSFQIDTLIITSATIYLYEVKYYEGDYYFETDVFYKTPETEYTNPLFQLSRAASLLRQLLSVLGFSIPIDGSVVFNNPEFTLYQALLGQPLILPNQVNRYLKKLDSTPSNLTKKHKILADKLISLHIKNPPIKHKPTYHYHHLRKGLTCYICNSFSFYIDGKKCVCKDCGHREAICDAVMRNVKEFQLLFPDQKITVSVIHEWCGMIVSKRWIRRLLENHFRIVSNRRWSYYEEITNFAE
jgi:hypothetical protein